MPEFAFRMRAHAAANFPYDENLTVPWSDAVATFQSEYTGGEDGRAYAVTIHGEIRGTGASLDEAQPRLAASIGNMLPLIALAANAAVATPLPIIAHGLDLTEPQELIAYKTPEVHEWFPPGKRRIDTEATSELITAIRLHPQASLLVGAIEAYRRALGHWYPEEQLLAGEYLFIAAETLTRFLAESRAAERGMTPSNLARLTGARGVDHLRRTYFDEIFDGTPDVLDALEEASNGFEHGFLTVDDVRARQNAALPHAFRPIRRALIAATGLADPMASRLLASTYDEPRSLIPPIVGLRGVLSRKDETLTAQPIDGGAVELAWTSAPPTARKREDGETDITFHPNATVTGLPENASLEITEMFMRAGYAKKSEEPRE